MLTKRRQKLAAIHIVKKTLGLSEKDYRSLLFGAAGVKSAANLQNDTQYFTLMRAFRAAGYKPRTKVKGQGFHCTDAQRRYIKGLWKLASRSKTERSLRAMVKRICGIDDPRFLSKASAIKLILALRDIAEKAGFNPDRKDTTSHGRP